MQKASWKSKISKLNPRADCKNMKKTCKNIAFYTGEIYNKSSKLYKEFKQNFAGKVKLNCICYL